MELLNDIKKNLRNIPGMQTRRRIVVFESDDWGSERARDKGTLTKLKEMGYPIEKCSMTMVDALESNKDLEMLFDMLHGFKDINGRSPVISAFFNVANPNYEKIKESGYRVYHYLNIGETAKKYKEHDKILGLYKEGFRSKVFHAEYHGREHIHVNRWLRVLQQGQKDVCFGFKIEFSGFSKSYAPEINGSLRAAYELDKMLDLRTMIKAVKDGLDLFEKTFGYRSDYFVSPNGIYPRYGDFELTLKEAGIRFLGGGSLQKIKSPLGHQETKHFYLGKTNFLKQIYITRNAIFEPHSAQRDWISSCLKDIRSAFRWNKPAIISTHRASYVGSLDPKNRERGIHELKLLIQAILNYWPNVEFMSTKELTELVDQKSMPIGDRMHHQMSPGL